MLPKTIPPPPSEARPSRFSEWTTWVTLAVLLVGAAYLCILVLRPFAEPLITGGVVAILFYPLHQWVGRHVANRSLAALLSTLIVIVAFVGPMAFIVSIVVQQLRSVFADGGLDAVNDGAGRAWDALQRPLETVAAWFGSNGEELRAAILSRIQEVATTGVRRLPTVVTVATAGVINAIIAIGALYFVLRDGEAFYEKALAHSPLGVLRTRRLGDTVHRMINASFWGVLAVAVTQGVLCGIGAWIAGLPSPALWGLAAAVASVLPLVGSALVWLPGAAVLFFQGSIGWGIFFLIWGAVLVANADSVVRPLVLTSQMPANGLVILITLLGGVQAFGLMGLLFGPVILAVTIALLDLLREEVERNHEAPG